MVDEAFLNQYFKEGPCRRRGSIIKSVAEKYPGERLHKNLVRFETDKLEFYGSVYLPSYKTEYLKDRIDF
jgi:hypothetical protein